MGLLLQAFCGYYVKLIMNKILKKFDLEAVKSLLCKGKNEFWGVLRKNVFLSFFILTN